MSLPELVFVQAGDLVLYSEYCLPVIDMLACITLSYYLLIVSTAGKHADLRVLRGIDCVESVRR
jgi:hypothetical protein